MKSKERKYEAFSHWKLSLDKEVAEGYLYEQGYIWTCVSFIVKPVSNASLSVFLIRDLVVLTS